MNIIEVSLKNIYGKVVCKSNSIDKKFG
ncbi:uncharacterized protein METZ01_LOCUS131804 [marine metagenome]|uniref:Uncharacterized protein n=1 Tax=marine metagenome TaxID=408172 RepID=A0A381YPN6_9ZZZZ